MFRLSACPCRFGSKPRGEHLAGARQFACTTFTMWSHAAITGSSRQRHVTAWGIPIIAGKSGGTATLPVAMSSVLWLIVSSSSLPNHLGLCPYGLVGDAPNWCGYAAPAGANSREDQPPTFVLVTGPT